MNVNKNLNKRNNENSNYPPAKKQKLSRNKNKTNDEQLSEVSDTVCAKC